MTISVLCTTSPAVQRMRDEQQLCLISCIHRVQMYVLLPCSHTLQRDCTDTLRLQRVLLSVMNKRHADVSDIGDTSYSAVLVDDLDNDGALELLVTTMSGHVYSFGTPGEYHPLKTWPAPVPGHANFVARHDQV